MKDFLRIRKKFSDFLTPLIQSTVQATVKESMAGLASSIDTTIKSSFQNSFSNLSLSEQRGRHPTIALWLDGPNLSKRAHDAGIRIPLEAMLHEVKKFGNINHSVVFHNVGCHPNILAFYARHNFTIITCVGLKKYQERSESDPVDEHLKKAVWRDWNLADIHLIGSADGDFQPLIAMLLGKNKKVIRFFIDERGSQSVPMLFDVNGGVGFGSFALPTIKISLPPSKVSLTA